jgi:hypothetical protein
MRRFLPPLFLAITLIAIACAPSQAGPQPAASPSTGSAPSPGSDANGSAELKRSDGQGSITVEVTPLNLSDPADKLEFDVALDTHSVDLSMDLALLATLTTDTGVSFQAAKWEATPGGHHVSGLLIFPATKDGKDLLEGASRLTLTIVNLDAPSRVFEWQLKQ